MIDPQSFAKRWPVSNVSAVFFHVYHVYTLFSYNFNKNIRSAGMPILIFWFLFSLPRYERFSYDFLLKLYIANIFFYIPYRTKFARRRPVLRDARMDIHFGTYFIKLPYFQNSIPINTMDFHNTYCYYNHQF